MTQRSKKASEAVVEDDGKTVDQAIELSMEIRSRSAGTSSEDAGTMVVTGSMPLLAPDIRSVMTAKDCKTLIEPEKPRMA